jgi:hypothetical protein
MTCSRASALLRSPDSFSFPDMKAVAGFSSRLNICNSPYKNPPSLICRVLSIWVRYFMAKSFFFNCPFYGQDTKSEPEPEPEPVSEPEPQKIVTVPQHCQNLPTQVKRQDFFRTVFGKLCFLWSRYEVETGTVTVTCQKSESKSEP